MKIPPTEKLSKSDAEYTDRSSDPAQHCCGICEQFQSYTNPTTCRIVEGNIKAIGGCKYFTVDLIENANNPYYGVEKKDVKPEK